MIVVSHTNVVLSFRDDDDEDEDDWYHLLEDTDDEEPLDEHHPPAAIGPPSPLDTQTIAMACVKQRHVTENEDGELMIAEYRKLPVDVPHTKDSIQYWNTFARISEDVYEDENHKYDVRELSQNWESFNKANADSFKRFLDILRRHKHYRGLAAPIIDPDTEKGENLKVPKLFVALRGGITRGKLGLLNSLCMIFCMNLHMAGYKKGEHDPHDPKYHYQPNTTGKVLNHIFSILRANGVVITQSDLKGEGSYHAYLENLWSETATVRSEFGRLPKRAGVCLNDEKSMRKYASPPLRPFEIYRDLLMMVFYKVCRDCSFRCLEVRPRSVGLSYGSHASHLCLLFLLRCI